MVSANRSKLVAKRSTIAGNSITRSLSRKAAIRRCLVLLQAEGQAVRRNFRCPLLFVEKSSRLIAVEKSTRFHQRTALFSCPGQECWVDLGQIGYERIVYKLSPFVGCHQLNFLNCSHACRIHTSNLSDRTACGEDKH